MAKLEIVDDDKKTTLLLVPSQYRTLQSAETRSGRLITHLRHHPHDVDRLHGMGKLALVAQAVAVHVLDHTLEMLIRAKGW
jgi:hypothetical protein